jgi:hypothetical protein
MKGVIGHWSLVIGCWSLVIGCWWLSGEYLTISPVKVVNLMMKNRYFLDRRERDRLSKR